MANDVCPRKQGKYSAIVVLATPQQDEKGTWTTLHNIWNLSYHFSPIAPVWDADNSTVNTDKIPWIKIIAIKKKLTVTLCWQAIHTHTHTSTFYHIYNVFHACQIVCLYTWIHASLCSTVPYKLNPLVDMTSRRSKQICTHEFHLTILMWYLHKFPWLTSTFQ